MNERTLFQQILDQDVMTYMTYVTHKEI